MSIPVYFDIVESNIELKKLLLLEIAKELNSRIPGRLSSIDLQVRKSTFDFLKNTTTYTSLVSGELAAHFGLPTSGRQQKIDTIIWSVANRMSIEFTPITMTASRFRKGLVFRVLLTDLSEVINLLEGIVVTEKGQQLDWLQWLLTLGDRIIISEYEIHLIPGKGRSGGGIMVPDNAGSWRVPPPFGGTIKDNWLTRAFTNNINTYLSIIEKILKDELQRI